MATLSLASSLSLANFIRNRRRANRLSQRELGELAGVGTRLVSELERGKTTIRMDAANKVLAVFGKMLGPVDVPRSETRIALKPNEEEP